MNFVERLAEKYRILAATLKQSGTELGTLEICDPNRICWRICEGELGRCTLHMPFDVAEKLLSGEGNAQQFFVEKSLTMTGGDQVIEWLWRFFHLI